MSIDIGWVLDSECCGTCGCLLDYFECDLCTDCFEDYWLNQEQDRYAVWDEDATREEREGEMV